MSLAAAMPDRNSFLRLLIARLPVDNLLPIYKWTRKPTLEAEAGNPGNLPKYAFRKFGRVFESAQSIPRLSQAGMPSRSEAGAVCSRSARSALLVMTAKRTDY